MTIMAMPSIQRIASVTRWHFRSGFYTLQSFMFCMAILGPYQQRQLALGGVIAAVFRPCTALYFLRLYQGLTTNSVYYSAAFLQRVLYPTQLHAAYKYARKSGRKPWPFGGIFAAVFRPCIDLCFLCLCALQWTRKCAIRRRFCSGL